MTNTFFEAILSTLDLVVLKVCRTGSSCGWEPPRSSWFSHVIATAGEDEPVTVAQALPFVGYFLDDAEFFWRQARNGRLRSDPFTMTDAAGAEVVLVASALVIGHRHLLVSSHPATSRSAAARCRARARPCSIRSPRQTDAGPAGAHRRRAGTDRPARKQRADSAKQQLAAEICEQLASLASAVDELAPLPKGVTSGQGR